MTTNFGLGQLMQATPTIVKRLRDALLFMIGGSLAFVTILAPKFNVSPTDFAQWSGFAVLGVKGLSMLFGVPDEEVLQKVQDKIDAKKTDV